MATLDWNTLELPEAPAPRGNFVLWRQTDNLVFLAGQTCQWNGQMVHAGKVGAEVSPEQGRQAARICMQNLLVNLRDAVNGDWTRVRRCIRLTSYVNGAPDFADYPAVTDGASDLIVELMGEAGRHARTTIGVANLPRNAAVEIEAIFEVGAPPSTAETPPFVGGA